VKALKASRQIRLAITTILIGCLWLPVVACAQPIAKLGVKFTPNHLGQSTSIAFQLTIHTNNHDLPPALTALTIDYPASIGIAVSDLGLVSCSLSTLELLGPNACPADSHMGYGHALAKATINNETLEEGAEITVLRANEDNGNLAILLYAESATPVSTELAIPGILQPTNSSSTESIGLNIPLISVLPEGADIAVTQLSATFGAQGLTYYEHTHHGARPYKPHGILLPTSCPSHGFPFTASLTFVDHSTSTSTTRVPCDEQRRLPKSTPKPYRDRQTS
jgi:hypothetical protein